MKLRELFLFIKLTEISKNTLLRRALQNIAFTKVLGNVS